MEEEGITLARLEERVGNWMKTTTDYRKQLCEKIDDLGSKVERLGDKLSSLPCSARAEITKGMQCQMNWLWIALTTITLGGVIFGIWMKVIFAK